MTSPSAPPFASPSVDIAHGTSGPHNVRPVAGITFGAQIAASLDSGAREWLVTDGLGGYAMGTVCGLRTRRYHGLLVVATEPPGRRMLGLVALDPTLFVGANRVAVSTHEWADGP